MKTNSHLPTPLFVLRFLLSALVLLALATGARAATEYWDTSTTTGYQVGNGDWGIYTNWTVNGGTVLTTWTNGNTADFNGSGLSVVTVNSAVSPGAVHLGNVPGNGVYTTVFLSGSSTLTVGGYFGVGWQNNAAGNTLYDTFIQTGGTINITTSGMIVGRFGAAASYYMNGGSLTTPSAANSIRLGNASTSSSNTGNSSGTLVIDGGTVNAGAVGQIILGATGQSGSVGTGVLSLNSGSLTVSNLTMTPATNYSTGTFDLNNTGSGSTLTLQLITNGLGTGTFNFNGGTLKPSGASAVFITNLTGAYIYAGGAVIDTSSATGIEGNTAVSLDLTTTPGQLNLVVQASSTTNTLTRTQGGSPSTYGDTLIFQAVLSPVPADGTMVTFLTNNVAFGTATTTGGIANLTNTTLPYSGGSSYVVTAAATNYPSALLSGGQQVNQYGLTITGAAAQNKPFDGTTAAVITGGTLSGTVNGDVITANTGTFAQTNVGTGIAVTVNLSGVNAGDYSLTQPVPGLTANIYYPFWTNTLGGLWDTANNWFAGTIASGSGFTADFSQLDVTADTTVSLNSPRTIGNLIFADTNTNSAAGWVLDDNANPANTLTLAGTTPTITVNALGGGKNVTISAAVFGTNGLTKAGSGTLALSGTNTYTGVTTVNGGVLNANTIADSTGSSIGLSAAANALTFGSSGGTLNFTGTSGVTSRAITFTGAGTFNVAGGSTLTVGTGGTASATSGAWGGSGGVTKAGGGTLNISNNCSYTSPANRTTATIINNANGGTFTMQAGTLNISPVNASGATTLCIGDSTTGDFEQTGGTVNFSPAYYNANNVLYVGIAASGGGTLNVSGGTFTVNPATIGTYGIVIGRQSTGIVTVGGGAGPATISTPLVTLGLSVASTGTTLNLKTNGTLITGQINVGNTSGSYAVKCDGGTLEANTNTTSFMTNSSLLTVSITTNGLTVDPHSYAVTIAQPLTDASGQHGALTVNDSVGGGTLTLSGTNTYSGNTTVNGGTLSLAQPTLSTNSTVSIASGAVLQLAFAGGQTNTVAALVLNGISQPAGVYDSTTPGGSLAGSTGKLLVVPPAGTINPNPPVLQVSFGAGSLSLAWPTNQGWILQTNSVGLTATSAWGNYSPNGLVTVTNVTIAVDPTQTNLFYRMVKP